MRSSLMPDFTVFERYQPIIDNWQAFRDSLSRPLPVCLWTNTLRTTPERLAALLAADGLPFEPLPWHPGGFKLSPEIKPGNRWEYLAGLYHIQEEVSMIPVALLDPKPAERVLDLCAAPGNKTAQIAVAMGSRGTVVANDVNYGRMKALRQALEGLGLVNVTTTTCNGANYPRTAGLFDKVLVDAPCSCEGTSRKSARVLRRAGPAVSRRKSRLQKALLRKAVQLCKPGGRIVYATCTYAPEENEGVIDAILREYGPDRLQLVPARIEGITASQGLTVWNDRPFHESLHLAMRIWPHQNDTGGFFVAVLEKIGPRQNVRAKQAGEKDRSSNTIHPTGLAPTLPPGRPVPPEPWLKILSERFGISPGHFGPYIFYRQNAEKLHIMAQDHRPLADPKPNASGMRFMGTTARYPKLSTAAAMMFGPQATRNYIDVDRRQIEAYVRRRDFCVSAEQTRPCTGGGYVLIRHQEAILGVGLYRPGENGQGGLVKSLFPKNWSLA